MPFLVVSAYTGTIKNGVYSGYVSGACGASPLPSCPNEAFPYVHDFGSILAFIELGIKHLLLNSVNRTARHFGVPGYDSIFDYWRGDITLVAEPPGFSGVTLPPDHFFIGPLIPQDEFPLPEAIANLPRDKPLVYFSMGSSGARQIVARIVESFEGKPYRVIAPVKFQLDQLPNVRVPSNVFVTDWVPALQVNKMAAIAVIHGGMGTGLRRCVQYGEGLA